jgi:hypothetical protein
VSRGIEETNLSETLKNLGKFEPYRAQLRKDVTPGIRQL